ncbi:MAG: right-handed parallel beta-helix repeat-containing protein, partial [Thermoguttaceae bacterium]|nr:right-handed parallel beta-helix repeat-containing protein [Thermoguttaceae bacterium]
MQKVRNRSLRLESLEERALLAVTGGMELTAAELAAPFPGFVQATGADAESPSLLVTTLSDVVDSTDGLTSIREAIAYAERFSSSVRVSFANGLEGTITLTGGAISINSRGGITIDGRDLITIDAGGSARAFEIFSDGVTLTNIALENGYDVKQGGAVYTKGDLTLTGVSISDSYSGKYGGAVYTAPGTHLVVTDSSFTDNEALTHGGGVFVEKGASAEISGSYFSGNTSTAYGGAVYVWNDASADISNSFFLNNNAPNGTIRNVGGELNLINVVISGNDQGLAGAASGQTTATNVTISNNKRSAVRGETGAEFTFYNSILVGGSSTFNLSGGASVSGDVNLSTKSFGTNFIQYDGGDLFAADGYTLYGDNQAKGAGNPAYNDTELDAMGNDRYYGGALDLGAIQQVISVTGTSVVFNGE